MSNPDRATTGDPADDPAGSTGSAGSDWEIVEERFDPDAITKDGSNFLAGNGYLGYRGTWCGWEADRRVGCTVSDTYDMADGKWRELCNAPNGLWARVLVDGEEVGPVEGDPDYRHVLDLRRGVVTRRFRWRGLGGAGVRVASRRFASYDDLHLLAQELRISAERDCRLELIAGVDGRVWSLHGDHFARVASFPEATEAPLPLEAAIGLECVTGERGTVLAVAAAVRVAGLEPDEIEVVREERRVFRRLRFALPAGAELLLTTSAGIWSSNDDGVDEAGGPRSAAVGSAERAAVAGFATLERASDENWRAFWDVSDVEIGGDPEAQRALRFAVYHNRIATPEHSDRLPIGARGLSCQAYQGAAFWDQEIFNLPVFLHTRPEVARRLLAYRHHTLDGARGKAARLGYEGAYYAWVSGDTGEELCPSFFFEEVNTGRPIRNHFNDWQMHVSPDIAVTVWKYVQATDDWDFVVERGAEILFEVARFLRSFAVWKEHRGRFEMMRLLGPDEYHENVDNNAFTNHQSRFALRHALEVFDRMTREHPDELAALEREIALRGDEVAAWRRLAERLYLPLPDPDTGLIEQFDGYFELEDVTPAELETRLLDPGEYWGWPIGVAVHTQVIKQADVLQLLCQQPDTTPEVLAANWAYYEPRTEHGSSLSPAIHAIVACRLGRAGDAYRYFAKSAFVDLHGSNKAVSGGTFIGGVHTAACAGTWQAVVHGFGGLRTDTGRLSFDPLLPEGWTRLAFGVAYRGGRVRIEITPEVVTVHADAANRRPLPLRVGDEAFALEPGAERRIARAERATGGGG